MCSYLRESTRWTVDATGFNLYSHNPVEVQVELTTRENVNMAIGTATESVTVTSQAPIIQSENAALGQVVQGKAVTDIPRKAVQVKN